MNKKAALKLKAGEIIMWSQKAQPCGDDVWRGRVLCVTPKGGIRVERFRHHHEHGLDLDGTQEWVAYHHVIRVLDGSA